MEHASPMADAGTDKSCSGGRGKSIIEKLTGYYMVDIKFL